MHKNVIIKQPGPSTLKPLELILIWIINLLMKLNVSFFNKTR